MTRQLPISPAGDPFWTGFRHGCGLGAVMGGTPIGAVAWLTGHQDFAVICWVAAFIGYLIVMEWFLDEVARV